MLDGRAIGTFVFEISNAHLHVDDRLGGKPWNSGGADMVYSQRNQTERIS